VSLTLTDTHNPLLAVTAGGAVAVGATLAQLSLLVDGKQVATGTGAVLTATWDTDAAGPGEHIITDSAGNMAVSAPVSVTVKGSGSAATLGADASLWLGKCWNHQGLRGGWRNRACRCGLPTR
jgi:hypothetical protein